MVAEGILLGPFTGGLNTASDPASIQDRDLTLCQNMELDLDGALRSRFPFEDLDVSMNVGAGRPYKMLGFYTDSNGTHYLIGSNGASGTYYFDGTVWQVVTTSLAAAAMVQYRDKAWLIADPSTTQGGGSWDPVNGFAAVSGIPRGKTITTNKERLWVGPGVGVSPNGARVTYSEVGDPNRWPDTVGTPGGGYLNVNAGDGQNIVNVVTYFSDILIFKERSTYRFTFNTNPASGVVSRLSTTVGSAGQFCIGDYEGSLYVLYDDRVYSLVNYNFVRVNIKVPLTASNPSLAINDPYLLSIWDDRLIIQYHNSTFVYNLRTQTWSTWVTGAIGGTLGRFVAVPDSSVEVAQAYIASNGTSSFMLGRVTAEESSVSEPMLCAIRTKHYDYQSPATFKKLAFWGADVMSNVDLIATVAPVVYAVPATWEAVSAYTWDELNTWDRPLDTTISITDTAEISGSSSRKFVKFIKALRFRQVYYQIGFITDGSIAQAPVKVFTLTTYVSDKQLVPKKVS